MGFYERIKELYEEERARQQRETELLRAASRVADALRAHGVEAVDAPIRGWLIHTQILPPRPTPPARPSAPARPRPSSPTPGERFLTTGNLPTVPRVITVQDTMVQDTMVRYHLGMDGRIYLNGKPIAHPGNAVIDAVEQHLAEIVVKNHLDPELFKDDDVQS